MTIRLRPHHYLIPAALLLGGLLVLPLLVYLFGRLVVGPYEGEGVGGFLLGFYADLFTGGMAAWMLALAPALLVLVWVLAIRLRRMLVAADPATRRGAEV